MAQQVLSAAASNETLAPHVRLFTAGLPSSEAPKWYYQDLQGQLQGPFDANTMSRWCGESALPADLKCLGVHPQDSNIVPSNAALNHFQPLSKLLDNARAGIQYMPVRLGKGSFSDEGPATPQSAAPPKGSRAAGPGGPTNHAQAPAGAATLSNGGPDVTRAVDQRASLAAAAAAAAAGGSMNGLQAGLVQQQGLQGSVLLQHLQVSQQQQQAQQQMQRPGSQPRQQSTPVRRGNQQAGGPPNQFLHEQHATMQQSGAVGVGAFMPPGAAGKAAPEQQQEGGSADELSELNPSCEAWEPALQKLLKREGFSGKDADVKWRVILVTGDRVGPFTTEQMLDWVLGGKPPKGINKQQAQQTAQNPPALQIAGILSSDYNAQRLPGAKFFKPLGSLLALVAAGMQYQAVNKHDLQRGLPNKGWNEGAAAGGSRPGATASPALPLPTGKAAAGGKTGKAAAARGAAAGNNKNAQMPASRSNNQLTPGNRSRSSTPAGMADGGEGLAPSSSSSKSSSFKHPMALRQQQRQQQQQEALLAAAGQALPGQPGAAGGPAALGAQLAKGLPGTAARGMAALAQAGSASRSILTAANSMGAAGMQPGMQQQQQLAGAMAAQQAAAGRFAQALQGPQQQFLTPQQQMQAASMAFLQTQQGATQAVWLKQQQLPGQPPLAGMYPAGQALLGYPGMPGFPMVAAGAPGQQMGPGDAASAAAMGQMLQNAGLPRTSSTGSGAPQQQQQQQPPPPSVSGAHGAGQQQLVPSADGQNWQLQQQQVRPPAGVPAFALGQPGNVPVQPGMSHSPQLMHAAALLFLHDQPQPQQPPKPDKGQTRWWVQRNERAFSGPFTGLQMYQAYFQPTSALRLTESTPIAAMAAAGTAAAVSGRDVPPTRAFAPMSCLLEAAAQGFVLTPWPQALPGGRDNGPSTLMVQQAATGATLPLQSVLSQVGLLALQQHQQQGGGPSSEHPQQADSSSAEQGQPGVAQNQQQQMLAAAKQRQQQQPQAQLMPAIRPPGAAAGGYIQLPNGSIVPAAGLVPMQGGGLAVLQPNPAAVAAPQPPVVDPLAVATALFTAGGNPNTIVWYIRTDGAPSGDGPQSSSIQGPFDPQDMLAMYREGRLGPATMLCATHRAGPGQAQQLPPPPLETFKPLHALMHTVSTPGTDMHAQQGGAASGAPSSAPGAGPGAPAGMMQPQMVPAGMILAQAPGSMGPVLFQVPVSSGGPQSAVLAMPAGLQIQQVAPGVQMPGMPQMAGPPGAGPYMQTPQGMVSQQQMMAALANQQQLALKQQQQQQQAPGGGPAAGPGENGPNSTGSASAAAPAGSAGPGAAAAQAAAGAAGGGEAVQRAGAVPPRVDTWGSLAAAQELLQRRPSASSSNGQQTPAAAAASQAVDAALAAAASSRRASIEGYHPHGGSAGMMMLSGGQHMHHQLQHQHLGPKSSGGSHHAGSFGGHPLQHHSQQGFGLSGPRSSSSSSARGQPQLLAQDSAAAAAAAASALAGGLSLQGGSSPSFSQVQAQQHLYMQAAMLAGMAPQSAAMQGMLQQQQQMQLQQQQQQQQAAAFAAVSAAAAAPTCQPAQPPPPPASSAAAAGSHAGAPVSPVPEAPVAGGDAPAEA